LINEEWCVKILNFYYGGDYRMKARQEYSCWMCGDLIKISDLFYRDDLGRTAHKKCVDRLLRGYRSNVVEKKQTRTLYEPHLYKAYALRDGADAH